MQWDTPWWYLAYHRGLPASVIAGALWDASGPRAAFLSGAAVAALALAVVALAPSLRAAVAADGRDGGDV
jgi:hypothetical protein